MEVVGLGIMVGSVLAVLIAACFLILGERQLEVQKDALDVARDNLEVDRDTLFQQERVADLLTLLVQKTGN